MLSESDIEFKPASTDEWSIIQAIAYNTWPVAYGELIDPEQLQYMLEIIYSETALKNQMLVLNHKFTLVYSMKQLTGFFSTEDNHNGQSQLMIHKLYLLPQYQGKDLGKIMLEYITSYAREIKHRSLSLKVFYMNRKAISFYQKDGFIMQGEEVTNIGKGYKIIDYVMIKHIIE